MKNTDGLVIPKSNWLISLFTDEVNPEATKIMESLDKGEISLFLPSCLIIQNLLELKEKKCISYQKSSLAFLSLMNADCVEVEERNLILNMLHRLKDNESELNPFEIYLSLKAGEMKIKRI